MLQPVLRVSGTALPGRWHTSEQKNFSGAAFCHKFARFGGYILEHGTAKQVPTESSQDISLEWWHAYANRVVWARTYSQFQGLL